MEIKTIGVVGAGVMGNGIAQVSAQAGYSVIMRDLEDSILERGMAAINKSLGKFVEKGKLTSQERDAVLNRIQTTTDLNALADVDLIIEAIVEDAELKKKLFQELDTLVREEVIFATNTSSIPITTLASATSRPERFIGMHFMNPVPLMRLVEVIRGYLTSDETTEVIMEVSRKMGKVPVEAKDFPGFISNRILAPMLNEAIFAYAEGVGSREAIDTVMKLGMNHPMGPLELADYVGLDVLLYVLDVMYEGYKDPKYRACPLLRKMVAAGHLGRKTGKGFYDYGKQ